MQNKKVIAIKNTELAELQTLRRLFHLNPELGFAEYVTTAHICEHLTDLGFSLLRGSNLYKHSGIKPLSTTADLKIAKERLIDSPYLSDIEAGQTGVIATLDGNRPGPNIGFRFDIDGLPIQESSAPDHLPKKLGFESFNNYMHACGHDGHIAIGLALAKQLKENQHQLSGSYHLIFQPAEELLGGGKIFAKIPLIQDLDYLFASHIGIVPEERIICGLSFLANNTYTVEFLGKSAHAGNAPHSGDNALLAANYANIGLMSLPRHGEGTTRIGVGKFHSDNSPNIISDRASFEFELRGQNGKLADLSNKAMDIIKGAATMQNVTANIAPKSETISCKNSPELLALIRRSALRTGAPKNSVIEKKTVSVCEDATYLMRSVQENGGLAAYIGLGTPTYGGHHNSKFDFDEKIMLTGKKLLWSIIEETNN